MNSVWRLTSLLCGRFEDALDDGAIAGGVSPYDTCLTKEHSRLGELRGMVASESRELAAHLAPHPSCLVHRHLQLGWQQTIGVSSRTKARRGV